MQQRARRLELAVVAAEVAGVVERDLDVELVGPFELVDQRRQQLRVVEDRELVPVLDRKSVV